MQSQLVIPDSVPIGVKEIAFIEKCYVFLANTPARVILSEAQRA